MLPSESMVVHTKIKPLDAFEFLFRVLKYMGYYKPVPELTSYSKIVFNRIYRGMALFVLILYVFQHGVFIYQSLGNLNKMMEGFIIVFNFVNIAFKFVCMALNVSRLDRINELLNSNVFGATYKEDEEILKKNKVVMDQLTTYILVIISIGSVLRFTFPVVQKLYNDDEAVHPAYFPFETNTWTGYLLANLCLTFVMTWGGYGDLTLDCLIAGYYTQAKAQISILRHHLEHLADDDDDEQLVVQEINTIDYNENFTFMDFKSSKCQDKLVVLVQRHDLIMWMTNEIETIVNVPMFMQFIVSAINVCTIVYRLSILPVNAEYFFHLLYLSCLIFELWIFCYYGSLLYYESLAINDSLYLSDWTSFSPRFRLQLLIVMERWKRPNLLLAAKLVPLALPTFISVLRGAYTMYTILKQT